MRIDVKKFLFIGVDEDRSTFFKKAQDAGIIDFIGSPKNKAKELPPGINNIVQAIKILRGLPTTEQEEIDSFILADGLAHKILQLKQSVESLAEEDRIIHQEMARIAIFGDFSAQDIHFIEKEGKRVIQFFFAKHGVADHNSLPDEVIFVGSEHGLDYFVSINPEQKQYPKLVEIRIEHSLGALKQRSDKIVREIHDIEQRLKTYAKYNTFLHHALIYKLNTYHLNVAQHDVQLTMNDSLFSVSGWVPENKLQQMHDLLEEMNVYASEIAIESSDRVPTYLENHGVNRIGEDVINIYDTPSPTDKDPSLWVLVSFALFFSFIMGDGGYGLLLLGVALYLRYKHPKLTGVKKRVLSLFILLCFSVIAWGFLTNSFFGISIGPDSALRKVSITHWLAEKKAAYHMKHQDATYAYWVNKIPEVKTAQTPSEFLEKGATEKDDVKSYDILNKFSDNIMMELALFIGVVHILISLLRYLPRNWSNLGWILFIIGGYLYLPNYLKATSLINYAFGIDPVKAAPNGIYLMAAGISIAIILSIIKNKITGIFEAMNLIQIFADIMSYLRLYALGLAGAIISGIINETALSLNFILGFLLVLVGHGLNLVLAIMGGIIHGLRLNFIEWYHYSFEGGGKQFKPLRKMPVTTK